jgi:RNA polymerase sigma-70 factor (ECF subfamily)
MSETGLRLDDAAIVEALRRGDQRTAEFVVRRYNRTLWRITRSILRDDHDAEDAVQETYLRAFTRIQHFRGDASLGTWLARIAINEALRRMQQKRIAAGAFEPSDPGEDVSDRVPGNVQSQSPERAAARQEIRKLVERAVDDLPAHFRIVFVLRVIEQVSINDTAEVLGIPAATVKTRLHRAMAQLRQVLGQEFAAVFDGAFPFGGLRCDHLTRAVLRVLVANAAHNSREPFGISSGPMGAVAL